MSCKDCEERKKFESSFEEGIPYYETKLTTNTITREFPASVNPNWLKWHMDDEDRNILVINETDWKFQMDNEFPIDLNSGMRFSISAGVYHRIIKGSTDLLIEVEKLTK